MPNWCNNILTISHEDPDLWKWFCDSKFDFKIIEPCPEQVWPREKHKIWIMSQRIKDWGTKWPVDFEDIKIISGRFDAKSDIMNHMTVKLNFDTANSPPIGIYESLAEKGFDIVVTFEESNCDFIGLGYSCGGKMIINDYSVSNFESKARETRHLHRDNIVEMRRLLGCPEMLTDILEKLLLEWCVSWDEEDNENEIEWEVECFKVRLVPLDRYENTGYAFGNHIEAIHKAHECIESGDWNVVILIKINDPDGIVVDGEKKLKIYEWKKFNK